MIFHKDSSNGKTVCWKDRIGNIYKSPEKLESLGWFSFFWLFWGGQGLLNLNYDTFNDFQFITRIHISLWLRMTQTYGAMIKRLCKCSQLWTFSQQVQSTKRVMMLSVVENNWKKNIIFFLFYAPKNFSTFSSNNFIAFPAQAFFCAFHFNSMIFSVFT